MDKLSTNHILFNCHQLQILFTEYRNSDLFPNSTINTFPTDPPPPRKPHPPLCSRARLLDQDLRARQTQQKGERGEDGGAVPLALFTTPTERRDGVTR